MNFFPWYIIYKRGEESAPWFAWFCWLWQLMRQRNMRCRKPRGQSPLCACAHGSSVQNHPTQISVAIILLQHTHLPPLPLLNTGPTMWIQDLLQVQLCLAGPDYFVHGTSPRWIIKTVRRSSDPLLSEWVWELGICLLSCLFSSLDEFEFLYLQLDCSVWEVSGVHGTVLSIKYGFLESRQFFPGLIAANGLRVHMLGLQILWKSVESYEPSLRKMLIHIKLCTQSSVLVAPFGLRVLSLDSGLKNLQLKWDK